MSYQIRVFSKKLEGRLTLSNDKLGLKIEFKHEF